MLTWSHVHRVTDYDQIGSNTQCNHSTWDGGAGHADYIACTCIAGGTTVLLMHMTLCTERHDSRRHHESDCQVVHIVMVTCWERSDL